MPETKSYRCSATEQEIDDPCCSTSIESESTNTKRVPEENMLVKSSVPMPQDMNMNENDIGNLIGDPVKRKKVKDIDIDIVAPRRTGRQIQRCNTSTESVEDYFRAAIYILFLDNLIMLLNGHLLAHKTLLHRCLCLHPKRSIKPSVVDEDSIKQLAWVAQFPLNFGASGPSHSAFLYNSGPMVEEDRYCVAGASTEEPDLLVLNLLVQAKEDSHSGPMVEEDRYCVAEASTEELDLLVLNLLVQAKEDSLQMDELLLLGSGPRTHIGVRDVFRSGVATEERLEQSLQGGMTQTGKGGCGWANSELLEMLKVPVMGTREFSWEDDPRRIVNDGRAILERTGESLARSHTTAIETEEIGTSVISELGDQRETLLRTKQRLAETNEGLSRSRVIMRKMAWNKSVTLGTSASQLYVHRTCRITSSTVWLLRRVLTAESSMTTVNRSLAFSRNLSVSRSTCAVGQPNALRVASSTSNVRSSLTDSARAASVSVAGSIADVGLEILPPSVAAVPREMGIIRRLQTGHPTGAFTGDYKVSVQLKGITLEEIINWNPTLEHLFVCSSGTRIRAIRTIFAIIEPEDGNKSSSVDSTWSGSGAAVYACRGSCQQLLLQFLLLCLSKYLLQHIPVLGSHVPQKAVLTDECTATFFA
uniref:Uncharacterized protein n=1 Tax=Timema cristinae TaxID=61476 RepID=A0A7R9GQR2_TIMCR|nr:unnamed protein product [Timema cristinae]